MSQETEAAQLPANLTASAQRGPENPEWGHPHQGWKVTLRNGRGNRWTVPYFMGSGLKGREPSAAEVFSSLVSDSECFRNSASLEDFAADLGYEIGKYSDRRKTQKVYTACRKISEKLETFLTSEEYEAIQEMEM